MFEMQIKTAEDLAAEALAKHQARVTAAIDAHVEAAARARQYNSAAHLASYMGSSVPDWAAEAATFVAWRDAVWVYALGLLAAASEGGAVPTIEDVLAGMPVIAWPDEHEQQEG